MPRRFADFEAPGLGNVFDLRFQALYLLFKRDLRAGEEGHRLGCRARESSLILAAGPDCLGRMVMVFALRCRRRAQPSQPRRESGAPPRRASGLGAQFLEHRAGIVQLRGQSSETPEHQPRAPIWLEDRCLIEARGDDHFVPIAPALPVTKTLDRTPRYLAEGTPPMRK